MIRSAYSSDEHFCGAPDTAARQFRCVLYLVQGLIRNISSEPSKLALLTRDGLNRRSGMNNAVIVDSVEAVPKTSTSYITSRPRPDSIKAAPSAASIANAHPPPWSRVLALTMARVCTAFHRIRPWIDRIAAITIALSAQSLPRSLASLRPCRKVPAERPFLASLTQSHGRGVLAAPRCSLP
jgi:hypothetical protein